MQQNTELLSLSPSPSSLLSMTKSPIQQQRTQSTTLTDTKVKIERTTSNSKNGDPTAKEKIKISAKLNENQLKKEPSKQFNCSTYFLLQILILILLILMTIWFIENFNGFSIQSFGDKDLDKIFNLHPLFMVFALIFVLANSLLFLTSNKTLKFARIALTLIILINVIIGSFITVYWHYKKQYQHFNSLHSWFGVITMLLLFIYFISQYNVYSSTIQNNNNKNDKNNDKLIENLRFIGIATLILSGITCLLGLSQNMIVRSFDKFNFNNLNNINNNNLNNNNQSIINENEIIQANLIGNTIGMFLFIYILSMIYLMFKMRYKPWSMRKREQIEKQLRETVEKAMAKLDEDDVKKI